MLLLITAGPFLVFVFLYLFGKNQFEIDTYPFAATFMKNEKAEGPFFLADNGFLLSESEKKEYLNQVKRLEPFFNEKEVKPVWFTFSNASKDTSSENDFWPGKKQVTVNEAFLELAEKDTTLEIETAKGPGKKRLPPPPRAFLFDKKYNLRGVYGLCNSLSIDTLMLEFKILTNQ